MILSVGEDADKRESSYTVDGNVNWCSHCKKLWIFLKKLRIELPCDPVSLLLGIHPKITKTLENIDGN